MGNHEYTTSEHTDSNCYGLPSGAPGYFSYFDDAASPTEPGCRVFCKGYYSYDLGDWHVVVLNSNCNRVGNCAVGSAQYEWLRQDLAGHTRGCVLGYWHHPVASSGALGGTASMQPLFGLLQAAGADLVLTGHDHYFERFAPITAAGDVDAARGVRQFVVGTGGRNPTSVAHPLTASEARGLGFGVLALTLSPGRYSWRFLPTAGSDLADLGAQPCRSRAVADTTAPTAPQGLAPDVAVSGHVALSWQDAADDVGVVAHRVLRDGTTVATVGDVNAWSDAAAGEGTTHVYEVTAIDASGNESPRSAPVSVPVPAGQPQHVFADGFESGGLDRWSTSTRMAVDAEPGAVGALVARAAGVEQAANAYVHFPESRPQVVVDLGFKVVSRSSSVSLLRLRNASGSTVLQAAVSSTGLLQLRIDRLGVTLTSSTPVPTGEWRHLQLLAAADGANGRTVVLLDGAPVGALSTTVDMGVSPFARLTIGETSASRSFDVAYDDVRIAEELAR